MMGLATLQFEMSRTPAALSLQRRGSIQNYVRPQLQNIAAIRHLTSADKLDRRARLNFSRRTCITTAAAAINASDDGASMSSLRTTKHLLDLQRVSRRNREA